MGDADESGDDSFASPLSSQAASEKSEKPPSSLTSYTYWKRDIPDAHMLPCHKPQRIAEPHSAAAGTLQSDSPAVSASKWNKAGTWEEREVGPHLRKWVSEAVVGKELRSDGREEWASTGGEPRRGGEACRVTVTGVDRCTGPATLCFVRGKRKLGYELELDLTVKMVMDEGDDGVVGSVNVTEFTDHDSDIAVSYGGEVARHSTAKDVIRSRLFQLLRHTAKQFEQSGVDTQ